MVKAHHRTVVIAFIHPCQCLRAWLTWHSSQSLSLQACKLLTTWHQPLSCCMTFMPCRPGSEWMRSWCVGLSTSHAKLRSSTQNGICVCNQVECTVTGPVLQCSSRCSNHRMFVPMWAQVKVPHSQGLNTAYISHRSYCQGRNGHMVVVCHSTHWFSLGRSTTHRQLETRGNDVYSVSSIW